MKNEPYDFQERLRFSECFGREDEILAEIAQAIPGAMRWRKASKQEDRYGTDYWIEREYGPPISIDKKVRSRESTLKYGWAEACIEVCSVYQPITDPPYELKGANWRKPGWTIDPSKRCDWILYLWVAEPDLFNEKRFRSWLVPFPVLCATAQRNWRSWCREYGLWAAPNPGYLTLNTFVPRAVIAAAMSDLTAIGMAV